MPTAASVGGEGTWSDRDIAEGRKLTAISVKTSRAVATPLPRSAQGENAERAISILSGTMMCGPTGAQQAIMMPAQKKKL